MSKRSYRGSSPPNQVLILGCSSTWSESDWFVGMLRPPPHPADCPCGCVRPAAVYRLAGRYPIPLPARPGTSRWLGGRADCPDGCGRRDLRAEKDRGLNRICLRCLCHSDDPEDWNGPAAWAIARAEARARERDKDRIAAQLKRKKGRAAASTRRKVS